MDSSPQGVPAHLPRPAPRLPTLAQPRVHVGSTSRKPYIPTELMDFARPGADHHEALPSRIGDTLHFRDGRVTDMDGAAVEAT